MTEVIGIAVSLVMGWVAFFMGYMAIARGIFLGVIGCLLFLMLREEG